MGTCSYADPAERPLERVTQTETILDLPVVRLDQNIGHPAPPPPNGFIQLVVRFPDTPEALGPVTITTVIDADFGAPGSINKYFRLQNYQGLGRDFYRNNLVTSCDPADPLSTETWELTANEWNQMRANGVDPNGQPLPGDVVLSCGISGPVDVDVCGGSYIDFAVSYLAIDENAQTINVKTWNEDRCQTILFSPAMRPVEHATEQPQAPYGPPAAGVHELISLHPNRLTMGADGYTFDEEVCRHSYATMGLDARGYGAPFFCSNQRDGKYNHVARLCIAQPPAGGAWDANSDLAKLTRWGNGVWVGSAEAPSWGDVLLYSHQLLCGTII